MTDVHDGDDRITFRTYPYGKYDTVQRSFEEYLRGLSILLNPQRGLLGAIMAPLSRVCGVGFLQHSVLFST